MRPIPLALGLLPAGEVLPRLVTRQDIKSHPLTYGWQSRNAAVYTQYALYVLYYAHNALTAKPMAMAITRVGELVKAARNGRSQKEFAEFLGVKQSSVSRYESGKANPPIRVIEQCMQLVHAANDENAPTADQLAEHIRDVLADPDLQQVRLALSRLLDAIVSERAQTLLARPAHQ